MANRCTAPEVKAIISTVVSELDIEVFIGIANLTITKYLGEETTLSAAQKKNIEMFFTAHLIACTRDQKPQAEGIKNDYSVTYQGKTDMGGLNSTFYGQQCLVLDTTGILAAKMGKKKASLTAITSFE